MKMYWWQEGLHIDPESEKDRGLLLLIWKALCLIQINHRVPGGRVAHTGDQQFVVGVPDRVDSPSNAP